MDNQVDEVKQKLDIVSVISQRVPLKKRGRHFVACCPFHGEKTPSFIVSPELQIFKCFGCGKAGDVFTFIQEYERIEFKEALEELAKIAGVTLVKSSQITQAESHQKTLLEINNQVALFYHFILLRHPLGKKALEYVLGRKISLDTIKRFKIGFAPANSILISNFLLKKGFKIPDLIATGTFGESHYSGQRLYDRFQDRLVFPLTDYRDRVLGFSGRVLPGSSNPNSAKYINSPETEIYHKSNMLFGLNLTKEEIRKKNSVVVVEGEFDMISPYQQGFQNFVALKGTAFTQEQLYLLKRYTDTIILGLDSDFAGNNAARRSIELADSMEFDLRVLTLGDKYKDPDEAVQSDPEFFKSQLEHTLPVWDFIIESSVKTNDIDSIKGKKEVLSMVLPFLVKITNSVIRSDYIKKLAIEIGSSEESVLEEAAKYRPAAVSPIPKTQNTVSQSQPTIEHTKTEKFEELLLTLILGAKKPGVLAKKMKKYFDVLSSSRYKIIAQELVNTTDYNPKTFEDRLPAELRNIYQSMFLQATTMEIESQRRMFEIKKTVDQISIFTLKDQLNNLSTKIAQWELNQNVEELHKAEIEYNSLLIKLSALQTKKN